MPRRGELRRLVDLARETALAALRQRRVVEDFDAERTEALLGDLAARLELESPPRRIECYDISNTMGTNSVGSMVVFEDGRPRPDHYRHFGIRTVEGADDFASMAETLRRRFVRHLRAVQGEADGDIPVDDPDGSNGEEAPPERGRPARRRAGSRGEESFAALPDLLIIDGGKGSSVPPTTSWWRRGWPTSPSSAWPSATRSCSGRTGSTRSSCPATRRPSSWSSGCGDEAHRFAITRHRARRAKSALRSRLDVVPGLGPVRKRALLRRFGSVEAIGQASVEELAEVVPEVVAQRIKELV